IEVSANVSPINSDNGELKGTVTPETIQDLPLIVSGAVRSATSFIILQPGVNTGNSGNAFNARTNGGLQSGDEAVLDGASAQGCGPARTKHSSSRTSRDTALRVA